MLKCSIDLRGAAESGDNSQWVRRDRPLSHKRYQKYMKKKKKKKNWFIAALNVVPMHLFWKHFELPQR